MRCIRASVGEARSFRLDARVDYNPVIVTADANTMQIRRVERFSDLQAIASDWNPLLERSSANGIFLTWEWIHLWWAVYGGSFSLQVLLAWRGDRLVGIAPLMLGKHPRYGRASPQILMMIGQGGDTLAERFAFICEPELEAVVTRAFVDYLLGPLKKKWHMLRFERMLDGSPSMRHLVKALEQSGLQVETPIVNHAPYAKLPEHMDAFLATRTSNFRSQYRSSWRKLEKLGTAKLRYAGVDIEVPEAIDTLASLHRERFASRPSSSFATHNYVRFHSRLAQALLDRGWLWLVVLEVDGKPIAARYDFVYDNKIWCMQGGWDPRYSSVRPGMILTGAVISWGIERGMAEYDFLCGQEDYKSRWSDAERRMVNVATLNKHTLLGRSLPGVRSLKRRLKGSHRHGRPQARSQQS